MDKLPINRRRTRSRFWHLFLDFGWAVARFSDVEPTSKVDVRGTLSDAFHSGLHGDASATQLEHVEREAWADIIVVIPPFLASISRWPLLVVNELHADPFVHRFTNQPVRETWMKMAWTVLLSCEEE